MSPLVLLKYGLYCRVPAAAQLWRRALSQPCELHTQCTTTYRQGSR